MNGRDRFHARVPLSTPRTRGCRIAVLVALLASTAPASVVRGQQPARPERCVECHQGLDDERLSRPAKTFATDVHAQAGFNCLACHGLLSEHAGPDPAAGFLSKPSRGRIHQLCGRCHSDAAFMRSYDPALRVDQVTEYLTSGHGRRLLQANDPDVATCVSCHPAHETRPPSDPESTVYPLNVARTCTQCHGDAALMQRHGIPSDQREEWAHSVHGRLLLEEEDLSAPTCNDCHGNHGAAPPGIASIRHVCGECHATMADFFQASGHVEIFERDSLPGCVTCHDNHAVEAPADSTLALRAQDTCLNCHQPPDSAGGEFIVMLSLLDSLRAAFRNSQVVLRQAENAGMEVSQALFELEDVNNALTKSRSAIHSFHVDRVKQEVDQGLALTNRGLDRGRAALDEHQYRRIGLAASASLILMLIVGLLLRIRELDRRAAAVETGQAEEMKSATDARKVGEEIHV